MVKLSPPAEFPWDGFGPTPGRYLDLACAGHGYGPSPVQGNVDP